MRGQRFRGWLGAVRESAGNLQPRAIYCTFTPAAGSARNSPPSFPYRGFLLINKEIEGALGNAAGLALALRLPESGR